MFIRFIFLVLSLISSTAFADMGKYRAECETWLDQHYASYQHIETIREYVQGKKYIYRANYRIKPDRLKAKNIGFDCDIMLGSTTGKRMVAYPSLTPYAKEKTPQKAVSSLPEKRLKYGGNACPELDTWKWFANEVRGGNYLAELPASCIWLKDGQRVYGPVKSVNHNGDKFVQVKLPDGKVFWIEPSTYK